MKINKEREQMDETLWEWNNSVVVGGDSVGGGDGGVNETEEI